MSDAKITVDQAFFVKCRTCDFEMEAGSVEGAEQIACEHINEESCSKYEAQYPNYEHTVEVRPITLIGRFIYG